ncbi:MAG TPA: sensor histidine kinase [Mycobacteriales bacterium]
MEKHFWERYGGLWHGLFCVGLAALLLNALVRTDLAPGRRVALGVLCAVWLAWYRGVAVPAGRREDVRLGAVYLAGMLVLLAVLLAIDVSLSFALFFVVPQTFTYVERFRHSVVAVCGVYAVLLGAIAARGWDGPADVAVTVGSVGVSLAFSLLIGGWTGGIIRQSSERAALIAELDRTRAVLAGERHHAGVLAERHRLSCEIHDTLAQGFTGILMLSRAAGGDPADLRERMALIERTARDNLAEARSMISAMTPPDLDGATLPEALGRLASRYRAETGAVVEVVTTGDPARPDPEADVVLLRVAQEALANVRKHAGATAVRLALDCRDGARLTVTDDGCGFDPVACTDGFGLRGMRARVEARGGTLAVRPGARGGTTLEVALP